MITRGMAAQSGIRTTDKGGYRIAFLNVLDATLARVVTVEHFLKDGEDSPFRHVEQGTDVEYGLRSIDLYKGSIRGALASA